MPILTQEQIDQIKQILQQGSQAIAIYTAGAGPEATRQQIEKLVREGYLTRALADDLIKLTNDYGRLTSTLIGLPNLTWEQVQNQLTTLPPLTGAEQQALTVAQRRAGDLCVGLGNQYSEQLGRMVINADQALEAKMRQTIRDATTEAIEQRKSRSALRSDLRQLTKDWSRDWDRIASTESQLAEEEGFIHHTVATRGEDAMMAKFPEPTACEHCRRLYLGEDGKPIIRPASWWELQGVDNRGRKPIEYKPVIGAVHPWCRCVLITVPSGMAFDDNWDLVPEEMIEKAEQIGFGWEPAPRSKKGTLRRKTDQGLLKSRKLHYRTIFAGLPISIENRAGSIRRWYDPHTNTEGQTKMIRPYGYIRLTEGTDGDHLDCFLGTDENAPMVYVVHQMKAPTFTQYDEDKVMLGFKSAEDAKRVYLQHYNTPKFFGSMTEIPIDEFRSKALSGRYRKGEKINKAIAWLTEDLIPMMEREQNERDLLALKNRIPGELIDDMIKPAIQKLPKPSNPFEHLWTRDKQPDIELPDIKNQLKPFLDIKELSQRQWLEDARNDPYIPPKIS